MLAGKPAVLVQIHRVDAAEGDQPLAAEAHKLLIGADRRAARGKPQHSVGFLKDLRGQQRRRRAHPLVVFCVNKLHCVFFASSSCISSNVGRLEIPP